MKTIFSISGIRKTLPLCLIAMTINLCMAGCVKYEAEPFTGHTLPRKTGYTTGITNDWLYFNLETGTRYNVIAPNQDIREGRQKDSAAVAMNWDIAFCGYRLRTNSGTSGIGNGGAADLGYGHYNDWTSKAQVEQYMKEHKISFTVDDSSTVYVTMSQNDWNKYLIKNHLDFNENPWFDPNRGPATQLVSANPVLAGAMSFSGPPPVYSPSFHTYVVRSADGNHLYKLQLISWYNADVEIGDEGGKISYYLDELK